MLSKDCSSSDDEDYVPTAKELKEAETNDQKETENELTGVALLKDLKRQREADDLFALMNEEDSKATKRQKIVTNTTTKLEGKQIT